MRVLGEAKGVWSLWVSAHQRSLHFEAYFTPPPERNAERFYEHLEQTLVAIEFLDPEKPRHLMARLRRLYGRSSVSRAEMNILRGILTETQKAARGELLKRKD